VFVLVLFALAFAVLAPVCWRAGRGVASRWRRLLVAAGLAAGIAAPALPTLVLGWSFLRGCAGRVVDLERAHDGKDLDRESGELVVHQPDGSPDVIVILLLWWALLNTALQSLRLPRSLRHLQQLPPVSEPALVARITELAARLGLRSPLVVETATVGGTMEVQAFAAGLLAPVVVVSDGIVHRLSPAERDAVLAHELAHVRHRSVLRYLAALALVGVATVLLSGFVPFYLALLWWFAALRFVRTLVGHRDEIQADLAAGRCAGFADVAAALDKIHAAGLQTDPTPWFHAVLSHPAPAVRAFHLARAAPETSVRASLWTTHWCSAANACAGTQSAVGHVAGCGGVARRAGRMGLGGGLGTVLLVVPLLPYLVFLSELRDAFQLHARTVFRAFGEEALRIVAIIAVVPALCAVAMDGATTLARLAAVRDRRLRGGARRARRPRSTPRVSRVEAAPAAARPGRLPRVFREVEAPLATASRSAPEVCSCAQGSGNGRQPCRSSSACSSSGPGSASAALGRRPAEQDGSTARRRVGARAARRAARQCDCRGTLAAVLRRAGQVDEAWQRIASVLRRRPKHGAWHATAALIALARGDMPSATAELAKAERLDPGGSTTVLARAEFDVARSCRRCRVVQALRELGERLPLAFLGDDAARLEGRLAPRSATSG
jgi:Zn-dependent protease with chaperone function